MTKKFLVTGGYGFIGSNFINWLARTVDCHIYVIDKNGYAANPNNINVEIHGVIEDDISKYGVTDEAFSRFGKFDAVFNFAAESHVDNSISSPLSFTDSNVLGSHMLLESWRKSGYGRFIHVSTDEVYGYLGIKDSPFTEKSNIVPSSPYSASKAASDLMVLSYSKTYGSDVMVTRCCNNYGPRQHVEKLIPKAVTNILKGTLVPIYGTGSNIREWIHVQDHISAVFDVFEKGSSGEVYNIGSGFECSNLDIVSTICNTMGVDFEKSVVFVDDRKGHDFRYAIDSSKLRGLGWLPRYTNHKNNINEIVGWYKREFLNES